MDERKLAHLLEEVRDGTADIPSALKQLRALPYEEVDGFARLDHHRALRCGFPEVVFSQGKTAQQVVEIVRRLARQSDRVLVTRVTPALLAEIGDALPEAVYHPEGRLLIVDRNPQQERLPGVLVVTGGTSDIPVAEEAALTAELMGNQVERLYDVGVAGLHRLLDQTDALQQARVIVVVAGMEGALASVVGGLVAVPVIAVPTSIGYGASFNGLAALLAMLNSCASGVAVVNIDNGFGAGYMAGMINLQIGTAPGQSDGPQREAVPAPAGEEAHARS